MKNTDYRFWCGNCSFKTNVVDRAEYHERVALHEVNESGA